MSRWTHRGAVLGLLNTLSYRILAGMWAISAVFGMTCQHTLGSTYYVSSSTGSDANSGTGSGAAWKTIAKVNGQRFQPGDSILFRRGDTWNESLVPSTSGVAGSPITFDAYGTGPAPNLTGYYAIPPSAWALVSGNAWKAPLPVGFATVNFCLFGSIWGQKVPASTINLNAAWDFYFANGYLYVYSVGNPAGTYNGAIVPMALSNTPIINISGQSWLTFQHILVNWFDQYGVSVQGTSDHIVFANMEADSMIPQGTQPLGFYINESAPGPIDIKLYNAEAHMNYDGFRFDGAAAGIAMVNDKAYANRDAALVDNTGAVTYSYCHFYASSLAVAGSTDVEWTSGNGPTAGLGNVPEDTPPAVQSYQRYPARVTLTVDDAGMTPGADAYYAGTVLPIADAAGVPVGAAVTVGYPLAQTLVPEFQSWINAGRDVTSHSISHTYYTNTDAIEIQYTGSGSSATLSISNKVLTIAVSGAADSVSYNLTQGQPEGTIAGLEQALSATAHFIVSENPTCQGPYGTGCSFYTKTALLSQDLADVSSADVKSNIYHAQLDVTRLTTDELTLSAQWMRSNLTGLPNNSVYVYPGGYETAAMQATATSVPYIGARGALKEDLGVKDTYSSGFDVENITSFGVNPTWQGLQPAVLQQKVEALVWKQMVWGVPWGIFWHLNELSSTEITNLIHDLQISGASIQTNTSLVNWLLSGTLEPGTDGNYYYKFSAASMALDFRPSANSPVVDAGKDLGPAYAIDINGVNQNNYGGGWEIGAHAYIGYSSYGGGGNQAYFEVGSGNSSESSIYGPMTYAARTDNAVLGTESGALPGASTGMAGAPLIFRNEDSDPLPFGRMAPMNTAFTDPDFGTYELWMTDYNLPISAGTTGTMTMNNAEGGPFWSSDDQLFLANTSGGAVYLLYVNTARVRAGQCSTLLPCVQYTGIRTAASGGHTTTAFAHLATLAFTRSSNDSPDTVYEISPYTQVNKGVIVGLPGCVATKSCTISWSTYVDFTSDLPLPCSVLPATYSSNSEWNGAFSVSPDGSLAYALGGAGDWSASTSYLNPDSFLTPQVNNAGLYTFQAQTSGRSGSSAPTWCQTVNCIVTDGTTTWVNIGKVGGQGPGFDLVVYQKGHGCSRLNTRLGKIYRGTANSDPGGYLTSDEAAAYYNTHGSICPNDGVKCTSPFGLTDIGTIHDGGGASDSTYAQWTPTGGGAAPTSPFKGYQSCRWSDGTERYCYNYYWQVATTLVRPNMIYTNEGMVVNGRGDSHGISGYNIVFKGYGGYFAHSMGTPQTVTGAPNPGTQLFSTTPTWDQHGVYDSANPSSTNPAMMAMTDVPSTGRQAGSGYTQSGYNEEIETNTTGSLTQWRMGHNWNTGSNVAFGTQNAFGSISPDGLFYTFATDGMGTRGSNTTVGGSCNELRGDVKWASNTAFSSGTRVFPVTDNVSGNIFSSSGGTSGSAQPNWGTACATACTDGTMTWTNLGSNNCRGDLVLAYLPSANQGNVVPSTLFGLHVNSSTPSPVVPFGTWRLWDTATRWQQMNPAASSYTFSTLDSLLAYAKVNGIGDVLLTVSGTPNFISSDATNSSCNYASTANGACGVPTDIAASCTNANGLNNCDGKMDGTNQTWRSFLYNLGSHIAGLSASGYQQPSSFEIWNEFSRTTSWEGTTAQLALLASDAYCILKGVGSNCTAAAMNVPAIGLLPTVTITTPDAVMTAPDNSIWGSYVATGGALTSADVAAVHAYTQNGSCCAAPETVMTRYNSARSLLTAAGRTHVLWSTEGGWGTSSPNEPDADLQAAFMARYYLLGWSTGFKRLYWYAYDNQSWGTLWNPNGTSGCASASGCLTKAGIAYGQVYSWMVGNSLTAPCSNSGTVWTCGFTSPKGVATLAVWDSSQTCSAGSCTYSTYTPGASFARYFDLTGNSYATVTGGVVQIGAKPILLSQ